MRKVSQHIGQAENIRKRLVDRDLANVSDNEEYFGSVIRARPGDTCRLRTIHLVTSGGSGARATVILQRVGRADAGKFCVVKNYSGGNLAVTPTGDAKIDGLDSQTIIDLEAAWYVCIGIGGWARV